MHNNLILLVFLSILTSIDSQYDDDRGSPSGSHGDRKLEALLNGTFNRGRCPQQFYQSGDECLHFLTSDKIYSWQQAEETCSGQIAHMLAKQQTSSMDDQRKITPTKGVRQVILNTPEKTEIFRVLFREFQQQNFAVRLSTDYSELKRCFAGADAKFPHYCDASVRSNSACLETKSNGPDHICIQEVNCEEKNLRVACEFTLPGSAEITTSQFFNCTENRNTRTFRWIPIIMTSAAVFVAIVFLVITVIMRRRRSSSRAATSLPKEAKEITKTRVKPEDPAAEPMINRTTPSDTGYLQPRSLDRVLPPTKDNKENA